MIAFKVCRKLKNGKFTSALYSGGPYTKWILIYEIGLTTFPKVSNSKIFICKTLEDAQRLAWLTGIHPYVIIKGEVDEITPLVSIPMWDHQIEEFWSGEQIPLFDCPKNTYLASWFKPIEVVEEGAYNG